MSESTHKIVLIEDTRIVGADQPAGTVIGAIDDPANYKTIRHDPAVAHGRGDVVRCLIEGSAEVQQAKRAAAGKGKGRSQGQSNAAAEDETPAAA